MSILYNKQTLHKEGHLVRSTLKFLHRMAGDMKMLIAAIICTTFIIVAKLISEIFND